MLAGKGELNICFVHSAYRMAERFAARDTGIAHFQVRTPEEFAAAHRRWARRHARRAACGRFGAVDHARRFDHAAYRG